MPCARPLRGAPGRRAQAAGPACNHSVGFAKSPFFTGSRVVPPLPLAIGKQFRSRSSGSRGFRGINGASPLRSPLRYVRNGSPPFIPRSPCARCPSANARLHGGWRGGGHGFNGPVLFCCGGALCLGLFPFSVVGGLASWRAIRAGWSGRGGRCPLVQAGTKRRRVCSSPSRAAPVPGSLPGGSLRGWGGGCGSGGGRPGRRSGLLVGF